LERAEQHERDEERLNRLSGREDMTKKPKNASEARTACLKFLSILVLDPARTAMMYGFAKTWALPGH
jgi:hypothetical protein